MEKISYVTSGTCAKKINFEKDETGRIFNISFEGMSAQEISAKLAGNLCGTKNTSCADQLAKAVMQA